MALPASTALARRSMMEGTRGRIWQNWQSWRRRRNNFSAGLGGLEMNNLSDPISFGGSQLEDSVFFAERIVIPYRPKAVVIQAGGNDINAGKSPERVLADFQAWVKKVRATLPDVRLVYLGQGPSPARWEQREKQQKANALVREFIATEKNMAFVDIWAACIGEDGLPRPEFYVADKLHPTEEQYRVRAKLIRPALEQGR